MVVCICKEIACPFFNENTNGFGCQRYNTASMCHLARELPLSKTTEYAIYESEGVDLTSYKSKNKEFFLNDNVFKSSREFIEANPDWIEGWKVGKLPD